MNRWGQALQTWLETKARGSAHTARSYRRAIDDLLTFLELSRNQFGEIGSMDVAGWANDLADRGLANTTIAQRLAAISSFYRFCAAVYTDTDGYNPVSQVERPEIDGFGNSRPLAVEQVKALLGVIDRSTIVGLRDYAVILFALYTGRRSVEIREMRIEDIRADVDGRVRYFFKARKRGESQWADLPIPVWQAIQLYWMASGRHLWSGEPVFVGHNGQARFGPLSSEWFNQMVTRYAVEAGIGKWVTPHILRHTASNLRLAAGRSVVEINQLLRHRHLSTTQRYVERLRGFEDDGWQAVEALIETPLTHDRVDRDAEDDPRDYIEWEL
jgi:integrase/recombinase XerC